MEITLQESKLKMKPMWERKIYQQNTIDKAVSKSDFILFGHS